MASISSITKAVSGVVAAQKGLQVTGHNISNTNTKGYTRQQLLQSDSSYLTIGNRGGYALKLGIGVTCDEIRQIRNEMADRRLRTENSVLHYYQKLNSATSDIESMFDEPYGSTISEFLSDFWSQAQKLSTTPDGVEERMSFISTAKVLMSKINVVTDSLKTYQTKLNSDVKTTVNRINEILDGIRETNEKISIAEAGGENANDYRDQRNLLLDELSQYGNVTYTEDADKRVLVKFEGHIVVNKQLVTKLELKQTRPGSPFDKPIWSDTKSDVYNMSERSSSEKGNDSGSLKALLLARGEDIITYDTSWDDVALNDQFSVDVEGNAYLVPKVQKLLNQFTNKLTEIVNGSFTGTGIGEHTGKDGVPVFIAINVPDDLKGFHEKFKAGKTTYINSTNPPDPQNPPNDINNPAHPNNPNHADYLKEWEDFEKYKKILIGGNVEVNPELLENGGYNKLGTVKKDPNGADNSTNTGDNTIVKEFLAAFGETQKWNDKNTNSSSAPYEKYSNMKDFFSELVTGIGSQGELYINKASEKNISVMNIENERQAMGGVSTDEEFSYMLKYQYAYNASARMITMLDGMLDTIINRM